ncbi:hypothetical protein C2857_000691 [Epichloe festucae Fl1]|uniref:BTB domain-containing protein n=1 Tax=Epichloe festucae (strain Fl1) TaxID=877507 RepID=A0A7U3SN69_EPIFF|nr:hypothetical protein C2857_000691 [Epichloe festucae Fl1]
MSSLRENLSPTSPSAEGSSEVALQQPRATDVRIKLLVGERLFTTTEQTLVAESAYFTSLLSGRWASTLDDGSYFIDSDPSLFEHILRYLRHSVCPIFYDQVRGHDFGLYLALQAEASYFGIPRLHDWLKNKRYFEAIHLSYAIEMDEDYSSKNFTSNSGTAVEFYPTWDAQKVYVCPRGIPVHRGDPGRCGRQCKEERGDDEIKYDDETVLRMVVVRKQVVVRPEVCMD